MVTNIYDLNSDELAEYFLKAGEPKYRAAQVFSALHSGVPVADMTTIPKPLREKLIQDFHCELPTVESELVSKDGTRKYLLRLQDNNLVECVLLTQDYGQTVCISSQVGCKMGCKFCASGADGFVRNLTPGEMLAQVLVCVNNSPSQGEGVPRKRSASASAERGGVGNIVIMGSGEPFDNFENTAKFLNLVTCAEGLNIGARGISVSTVGIPDKIRAFADLNTQVNLCISLHAPNDEIRKTIMPMARVHPIREIIAAAKYFFDKTRRRVIFEYALIDGVNCMPEHARELAFLLKGAGFASHVNLISLNNSPSHDEGVAHGAGVGLSAPPRETAMKFIAAELSLDNSCGYTNPTRETSRIFMDTLIKNGVSCTMRKSRGTDIFGACGQLKLQRGKNGN